MEQEHKNKGGRVITFDIYEMFRLRQEGWTFTALAKKYQKDHSTIIHHCQRHHIVPYTEVMKKTYAEYKKPEQKERTYKYDVVEMIRLRVQGVPITEIARRCGVNKSCVSRRTRHVKPFIVKIDRPTYRQSSKPERLAFEDIDPVRKGKTYREYVADAKRRAENKNKKTFKDYLSTMNNRGLTT